MVKDARQNIVKIEGLQILNVTQSTLIFVSEKTGKEYTVDPCGFVLKAQRAEEVVSDGVITVLRKYFKAHPIGENFVNSIDSDVIIVGSSIASGAYSQVVSPVPIDTTHKHINIEKKVNLFQYYM